MPSPRLRAVTSFTGDNEQKHLGMADAQQVLAASITVIISSLLKPTL